jgi:hypothetical protein
MTSICRVHIVDDVFGPFETPGLHFRPKSVAKADHRQAVMRADFCLHCLVIASLLPHHEQQQSGWRVGLGEDLAHEALEGLSVGPAVVYGELDHDEVR